MKKQINGYEIFLKGYETASHKLAAYSMAEAKRIFKKLERYDRMPYGTYFRVNYRCPLSDEMLIDQRERFLNQIKEYENES